MSATSKVLNVLMIDDSEPDFVFVNQLLSYKPKDGEIPAAREPDFSVVWAEDMPRAVKHTQASDFDAILLDYFMPKVEGFEALNLIVQTVPLTPVIMLTGTENDELGHRAIELGAQDFQIKGSLSRQLLIRTIRYSIARLRVLNDGVAPEEFDNRFYSDVSALRGLREAAKSLQKFIDN